jgi:uncharacterized protein
MHLIYLVVLGLFAGVASGLFGVGGGIVIVPALVLLFGFTQTQANGTSLVALLLPVGSFAVYNYWKSGALSLDDIKSGLLIGCGISMGAIFGSQLAMELRPEYLRRAFAIFILFAAYKIW